MNPILPPKKRESRQGSSEQRPLEEEFKLPAPLPTRRLQLLERREAELRADKDLLLPPPPPPTLPQPLAPVPLSLPWHLPYYPSLHGPYLTGHVRDRRGSGSPSWRENSRRSEGLETISHNSSWQGRDNALSVPPSVPVPTYKGNYALNSRDLWSYSGHAHRDYSSSLIASSSSHLFPPSTPLYHPNLLSESRLRYSSRRPNGLEPGATTDNLPPRPSTIERGSRSQEGPDTHSSQNPNRDVPVGLPKPHTYLSESGRRKPHLEPSPGSASQSGAQIYYALGSLYSPTHPKPSGPPQPPLPPLRNSSHTPHAQLNNHTLDQEPPRPSAWGPEPAPGMVLPHFVRGSLIELAGGRLKRVEEMQTQDFLQSAHTSPQFHLSTCTVLLISPGPAQGFKHLQVLLTDRNTQELLTVLEEYPFFVRDRGWSSCSPGRSSQIYGLQCRQLSSGDVCLALTPTLTSATSTPTTSTGTPPPPVRTSSTPTPTDLQTLSCTRTRTHLRFAPPTPDSPGETRNQSRPRKRRWSAPELQPQNTELPQSWKRVKPQ